jgi:uroporphyrinogen decarboxylase
MNQRERFLATAEFQRVDRAFLLEPWAWAATLRRWSVEGFSSASGSSSTPPADGPLDDTSMRRAFAEADLAAIFQTDREQTAPVEMQGRYGPHLVPPLERKLLSESAEWQIVRDEEGNTVRLFKDDPTRSMPEWIEYPMQGRSDWETLVKPRLDPRAPGRCPQGQALDDYASSVRNRDYALGVWAGSFYGWPRSLMGVQRLSLMLYDDPGLVHEMCEHIADFTIETLRPVVAKVQFDFAMIWEDMAGKDGPLCSPATYRRFMLGPLRRVTDFLHGRGIQHIILDSDGNNDVLVPLWLEAGVTGLRPFEIAARSDPVTARRQYGKGLVLQGGIDKRALARGPQAIDREVLSKVPWLCLQGGYFPQVDHLVPPDVSLENYTYYARLLRAVVEDPERHLHEARSRGFWTD